MRGKKEYCNRRLAVYIVSIQRDSDYMRSFFGEGWKDNVIIVKKSQQG